MDSLPIAVSLRLNPGLGSLFKIREVSELKSGNRAHSF